LKVASTVSALEAPVAPARRDHRGNERHDGDRQTDSLQLAHLSSSYRAVHHAGQFAGPCAGTFGFAPCGTPRYVAYSVTGVVPSLRARWTWLRGSTKPCPRENRFGVQLESPLS
jgi:hypothetical protein